jgi:nucleotide-binding universal stress UspA family protein
MQYTHIVGATDFSDLGDLALGRAVALARGHGARLTLLHVLPEPEAPSPLFAHYYDVRTTAENVAKAKAAAEDALRERIPADALAWLDLHVDVRCGDPASEILAADAELAPDLIVVATHGRRGLSRMILGSVAERVLQLAKADVLAVRARPAGVD